MKKNCPVCENNKVNFERELNNIKLLRCNECGFVYANLSKKRIEIANSSYDETFSNIYNNYQSSFDQCWFEYIVRKIEKKVGKKGSVLDIGCGNGMLLSKFKKRGWTVAGLDFSPWAKIYAKKIGFKLYSQSLDTQKIPKNRYDVIVCTSTLEHIEKPKEFLDDIYKILKHRGIAYFSGMPNYGSILVKLGVAKFESNKPPMHVSYFTPRSLNNVVRNSLFSEYKISSYGIPGIYQIYKKLPKSKGNNKKSGKKNNKLQKKAAKLYYYFGKPLGLGDKLELILEK